MIEHDRRLHGAFAKEGNLATLAQNSATMPETLTQPTPLKALSNLVLERNHSRNLNATMPENQCNPTPKNGSQNGGIGFSASSMVIPDGDTQERELKFQVAPSPLQPKERESVTESAELWVMAWTPSGYPILVKAKDQAHARQIERWNPRPAKAREVDESEIHQVDTTL